MVSMVETLPLKAMAPGTLWDDFQAVMATDASWSALVLRLVLGVVMFAHGAQKVLGWFGGYGLGSTLWMFTMTMKLPLLLALLVIIAEFFGSLALIAGVLTRFAALGIGAVMIGAIATVHAHNGFFMNWAGKAAGEGFEYHLLAIAISLALVLSGGGSWSVDRALAGDVEE